MSAIKANIKIDGQEEVVTLRFRHWRKYEPVGKAVEQVFSRGAAPKFVQDSQLVLYKTTAYITVEDDDSESGHAVIGTGETLRSRHDLPSYESGRRNAIEKLFHNMEWFKTREGWENRKAILAAYEARKGNSIAELVLETN